MRQSKDVVEVADRQQLGLTVGQPLGPGQGLAFGAMTVAAGVVDRPLVSALIALFQVAAQGGGATAFDGSHDPLVFPRQGVLLPVGGAVLADDVGDLVGRPRPGRAGVQDSGHGGTSGRWQVGEIEQVQRTLGRVQGLAGQVQVPGGGSDGGMAHQDLDGAQIDAGLEQVGGEAMAQHVDAAALADTGLGFGLIEDLARLVVVEGDSGLRAGNSQVRGW